MHRVMIVDDEPIVRAGLIDLVDWNECGFVICDEAINGEDAFEKIKKSNPDIVITDVNMPKMSGLDLIEKAKTNQMECEFIILSECGEFEYAKRAMAYGVTQYLLKPVNKNEMIDSLRVIKKQIEKKEMDIKKGIYDSFFRQVLLNVTNKNDACRKLEQHKINLSYNIFNVAIIHNLQGRKIVASSKEMDEILYFVSSLKNVYFLIVENRVTLISKGVSSKQLQSDLIRCNNLLYEKYKKKYYICLGHDVGHFKDINFSYECAKYLQSYRFIFSKEEIITIDIFPSIKKVDETDNIVTKICMLIEASNTKEIKNMLDGIKQSFTKYPIDESSIKLKVMRNMILVQNRFEKKYLEYDLNYLDIEKILKRINSTTNLDDMFDTLYECCLSLCKILYDSELLSVSKRIYLFMEKNYDADLKLENIAKIFNYNKAYLGKIIKQELGDYYNNILDNIRITKAKELLVQTNLKVYQISEKVGYCTLDYFYIKFKKHTGISPTKYRTINKVK